MGALVMAQAEKTRNASARGSRSNAFSSRGRMHNMNRVGTLNRM